MNKLGATLAHLRKTQEAIDYYNQSLEIKPNYVRVWVNLGIAYDCLVQNCSLFLLAKAVPGPDFSPFF